MSAYATDAEAGDVPLKSVGCQVIEETRAAQPHRRRIQSASHAESTRDEGCREGESPQLLGQKGGNGDTATSQSGGQGILVVGSL